MSGDRLQEVLFDFLDRQSSLAEEEYLQMCCLYGELVLHKLFSYDKYMQRLICRGDLERERPLEQVVP